MNSDLFMQSRKGHTLVRGIVLAATLFALGLHADEYNKKTILTVNQPIQVRETLLQPGQYVLKLMRSDADRHIVQIFNGDESHLIDTILAVPAQRLTATGNTRFTFWETPAGDAKALRTWFYPGDLIGNEFPYPQQLHQLAAAMPPVTPAPEAAAPAPATTPAIETPAPPAAVTEPPATSTPPAVQQAETSSEETQTAETTPAPTPTEGSADRAAPTELPKTASPYPLIGLCGLALAALGGLLRLRLPA